MAILDPPIPPKQVIGGPSKATGPAFDSLASSSRAATTLSFAKIALVLLTQVPLRAAAYPVLGFLHSRSLNTTFANDNQVLDALKSKELLSPRDYWIDMGISCTLVLLGGVFAGLTLGLMGQDEIYLQVIQQSGEPSEKKAAGKVLSLLNRGKHWVLVTLLLSNVITNESLPIVLDRVLGGGWPAIVSSTVAIVIFGEIIPQSVSVRYGLSVGAWFAPFVLALMYIMYPVAYPVAMLLDWTLGEDHGTIYKRAGLKTLVGLHKTMGVERLNDDEVTIISAVLDLKDKPVALIMTPMENVFTMSADTCLDEPTVEEILRSGFNRIPIHAPDEPTNFIGMLLVRTLITYDPEDNFPISSFPLATLPETGPETSCLNILNYFQEGKSHMVVVSKTPGASTGALGVVTLEDVIEELIGEEIIDESDVYVDIHNAIRRSTPVALSKVASMAFFRHSPRSSLGLENNEEGPIRRRLLNPLNRASNPKQTTSANITIKRSNLENFTSGSNHAASSTNNHANHRISTSSSSADTATGGFESPLTGTAPVTRAKSYGGEYRPSHLSTTMTQDDSRELLLPNAHSSKSSNNSIPIDSQLLPAPEGNYGTIHRTEQGAIEEALLIPKSPGRGNSGGGGRRRFSRRSVGAAASYNNLSGEDHYEENIEAQNHHAPIHLAVPGAIDHFSHGDIAYQDRVMPNIQPEFHSYRTGGIIESVVQVDGVNKTIIEDVTSGSVHTNYTHPVGSHAPSISTMSGATAGPSGDYQGNAPGLVSKNNTSSNGTGLNSHIQSSASSWMSRASNEAPDQQPLLGTSPNSVLKG